MECLDQFGFYVIECLAVVDEDVFDGDENNEVVGFDD